MTDERKSRVALREAIRIGDIHILLPIDLVNIETIINRLEAEIAYKDREYNASESYRRAKEGI